MKPITRFWCTECGEGDRPCRHWEAEENDRRFRWIEAALCEMIALQKDLQRVEYENKILLTRVLNLLQMKNLPTSITISQLNHEGPMSTPAGGSSVFQELPTPQGAAFPAGTTFQWTVDDTADISLSPSSDGTQVTAACVGTPAATNYNLTCTSNFTPPGAPTPISATINVAIVTQTPTPTGMTINQLS